MDNSSQEEKARGRRRSGYRRPSCDKKILEYIEKNIKTIDDYLELSRFLGCEF